MNEEEEDLAALEGRDLPDFVTGADVSAKATYRVNASIRELKEYQQAQAAEQRNREIWTLWLVAATFLVAVASLVVAIVALAVG